MLSHKEILDRFEITRTTLHNWKTTKPKLYDYLKNFDGKNDELRDIKSVLDRYAEGMCGEFEYAEIDFLLSLGLEFEGVEGLKNMVDMFGAACAKEFGQRARLVVLIYSKLERLNIIERYIFADRYRSVQKQLKKTKEAREDLVGYYFKPFLVVL